MQVFGHFEKKNWAKSVFFGEQFMYGLKQVSFESGKLSIFSEQRRVKVRRSLELIFGVVAALVGTSKPESMSF